MGRELRALRVPAPFAVVAAIVVVPTSLVVVNLVGALPALTAARVRTAEVLRAE